MKTKNPYLALTVILVTLLFLTVNVHAEGVLEAPHQSVTSPSITSCIDCHDLTATDVPNLIPTPVGWVPRSSVTLENEFTIYNLKCWECHNGGVPVTFGDPPVTQTLADMKTHSSLVTDSTRYGEWAVGCTVCHNPHSQGGQGGGKFITNTVTLDSIEVYGGKAAKSGNKMVVFDGPTGPNSFADGDSSYYGICEVCHTETKYHRNDASGDHTHYPEQDCRTCHSHAKGFSPNCDTCHGNPPVDAGSMVSFPSATGSGTAGKHGIHAISNGGNIYPCATCHFNGMPDTPINGNDKIQIGFSGAAITGADGSGTTYRGQALTSPYSYEQTNGTTVTVDGTMTCGSIYCHSIVQTITGSALTPDTSDYKTPTWGGTSMNCSSCHSSTPPSGSHPKHIGTGQHCYNCHYSAFTPTAICTPCHEAHLPFLVRIDTPLHVNNEIDVDMMATGTIDGIYNGSKTPADGFSTCDNTYCHSNGTSVSTTTIPANTSPAWGSTGPLACDSCHNNPPAYSLFVPKANEHDRHNSILNDNPTRTGYSCEICHYLTTTDGTSITDLTNHVNGQYEASPSPTYPYKNGVLTEYRTNEFTYTYDTGGGTCSNISCHGDWGRATTSKWGQAATMTVNFSRTLGVGCYGVSVTAATPVCDPAHGCQAPYTYTWDFGDGTVINGSPTETHDYNTTGSFDISLNIRSSTGLNDTRTIPNVEPTAPPNIQPTIDKNIAVVGMVATITDLSVDPDFDFCDHTGPAQVRIDWDGTIEIFDLDLSDVPSNQTFSHTYSSAGDKTIKYYIWDNGDTTWRTSPWATITVPQ